MHCIHNLDSSIVLVWRLLIQRLKNWKEKQESVCSYNPFPFCHFFSATLIWEQAQGKTNSMDFAEAIDNSELEEFGFTDDFIIELWGVITDARSGRLKWIKSVFEVCPHEVGVYILNTTVLQNETTCFENSKILRLFLVWKWGYYNAKWRISYMRYKILYKRIINYVINSCK